MGPGYFVIAILGCADGSIDCTQVMTVPTRYESASACSAAVPDVLMRNSDFDFPSLLAECRPADRPASADKAGAPAKSPSRNA